MSEMILMFSLGVVITVGYYIILNILREKRIKKLIAKTLVDLVEESTMRIGERARILSRDWTEEEKDKIIDEYYNEYKQNKVGVI